jgi:hypothetical protein
MRAPKAAGQSPTSATAQSQVNTRPPSPGVIVPSRSVSRGRPGSSQVVGVYQIGDVQARSWIETGSP